MDDKEHPRTVAAVVEPLLSVAQVCTALIIGRSTLYELVRAGELDPTYCGGSRPRFEPGDLREFIRPRRRTTYLPDREAAFIADLIERFDAVPADEDHPGHG